MVAMRSQWGDAQSQNCQVGKPRSRDAETGANGGRVLGDMVAECYWIVCADSCFAFVPAALDRKLIGRFVKTEQDCFQWPTLRAKSCRKEVTGTDFTVIPITFL